MSVDSDDPEIAVQYVPIDATAPGWLEYTRRSGLHTFGHCPAVVLFDSAMWLCTNPAVVATSIGSEYGQTLFADAFVGEPHDVPHEHAGSAVAACDWVRNHLDSAGPAVPSDRRFPLDREVTDRPGRSSDNPWTPEHVRRIDRERRLNSLAESPAWRAVYLLGHDSEERRRRTREEFLPAWFRLVARSRVVQRLADEDWVTASVWFTRQPPRGPTWTLSARTLTAFVNALGDGDIWAGGITATPDDPDLSRFAGTVGASVQYEFLQGDTPRTARASFPTYLLSLLGMTEHDGAEALRYDIAALRPRVAVYGIWRGDRWDSAVGDARPYQTELPALRSLVVEAPDRTAGWQVALADLGELTEYCSDDGRYLRLTIEPDAAAEAGRTALDVLQDGGVDVSDFLNATRP